MRRREGQDGPVGAGSGGRRLGSGPDGDGFPVRRRFLFSDVRRFITGVILHPSGADEIGDRVASPDPS